MREADSGDEPQQTHIDVDKRMQLCRQIFRTQRGRVFAYHYQRATAELSAYSRLESAIVINKGVSFGLAPLVGAGIGAHIYKVAPTDLSKHKMAGAGVLALAVFTNIWATYSSSQLRPMEDRLIEKYIWPLPNDVLEKYKSNHAFPNAK